MYGGREVLCTGCLSCQRKQSTSSLLSVGSLFVVFLFLRVVVLSEELSKADSWVVFQLGTAGVLGSAADAACDAVYDAMADAACDAMADVPTGNCRGAREYV